MSYADLSRGRHSLAHHAYHVTTVTAGRWPYFGDLDTGRLVVVEMRRLHHEAVVASLAWVLMPDHLHWLFQLGERRNLGSAIKLLKARSARAVNERLGRRGAVWQRAYYDHAVRVEEELVVLGRYIVANPVRAGLVDNIRRYPLWDAAWV